MKNREQNHLDVVAFTNKWEDWPGPKGGPSFYSFVATCFDVHQLSRPSVASPSSLAAVSCFYFLHVQDEYNEDRHVLLRVRSLWLCVSPLHALLPRPNAVRGWPRSNAAREPNGYGENRPEVMVKPVRTNLGENRPEVMVKPTVRTNLRLQQRLRLSLR